MKEKLECLSQQVDAALAAYVPERSQDLDGHLPEAMRYSLLNGGKRIRPVLTLAFCELAGGDASLAMPFACAVEMVHTYSLIHDDLPCMDDDGIRRGKPANHIAYGEAAAVLAGDALLTKAFEVLLSASLPDGVVRKGGILLAANAGEHGMVSGQTIDLQQEGAAAGPEILMAMDRRKTVALISAACQLGCYAAQAPPETLKAAGDYAEGLGMAFQIRDDILGAQGDESLLGKTVGLDAKNEKSNYVAYYGIHKAQEMVEQYTKTAVEALAVFSGDSSFLQALAWDLAKRDR